MSSLLSLMGWTFLPNLASSWVQSIYYGITIRAGEPKPQPGSPRYATHRRRITVLVVSLYLLYTLYEADYHLRQEGTYYSDLGLPSTASEREVKTRFRRLAALHHPDKSNAPDANEYFVHLKTAADTLTDPLKRFAYERFGPGAAEWRHCSSVHDYVMRGLQIIVPYYAAAGAVMWVLGLFGYLEWGRWWRWVTMAGMLVFEVHVVTRPDWPGVLAFVNPLMETLSGGNRQGYLPFEAILLLRKGVMTLYIALTQLGPLLAGQQQQNKSENEEVLVRQGIDRIEAGVKGIEGDVNRMLDMEMAPFAGDPEALSNLRGRAKEWLVQNTIRADPMVRDALGKSLQRRRTDAPAGAKGTK